MGVDFQIFATGEAVVVAKSRYPRALGVYRNAMQNAVGLTVEPAALVDAQIGGIVAVKIAEYAKNISVLFAYVQLFFVNILP